MIGSAFAAMLAATTLTPGNFVESLERAKAGEEFHARLRTGFAALAKAEPDRIVTIDANGTPDEVWELVWKSTRRFL